MGSHFPFGQQTENGIWCFTSYIHTGYGWSLTREADSQRPTPPYMVGSKEPVLRGFCVGPLLPLLLPVQEGRQAEGVSICLRNSAAGRRTQVFAYEVSYIKGKTDIISPRYFSKESDTGNFISHL